MPKSKRTSTPIPREITVEDAVRSIMGAAEEVKPFLVRYPRAFRKWIEVCGKMGDAMSEIRKKR